MPDIRSSHVALPALLAVLVLAGCGGTENPGRGASPGEAPEPIAEPAREAGAAAGTPPAPSPAPPGAVTFRIAGETGRFDHLPADRNVFSRYGSTVTAKPSATATEALTITFLSIDLGSLDFPADLPPAKDLTRPMSPSLAMASVGFSYVDDSGNEWAGPGALRVESFSDGRISGSFQSVSLPHVDKSLDAIELTDGTFSARLR